MEDSIPSSHSALPKRHGESYLVKSNPTPTITHLRGIVEDTKEGRFINHHPDTQAEDDNSENLKQTS